MRCSSMKQQSPLVQTITEALHDSELVAPAA